MAHTLRRAGKKIQAKVDASKEFPATEKDLFALAKAAGVDLERVRDPWGRRYYVKGHVEETYYDKVSFYTYAEYGRVEETRKKLTPARQRMMVMELRSSGPDGSRGTWDDFPVYSFFRVIDGPLKDTPSEAGNDTPRRATGGKGIILGTVTDISGAVVPGARVTINGGNSTDTDANGKYYFAGLPKGMYVLEFAASGFQRGVGTNIPSEPGQVTRFDFRLNVGTAMSTVEVSEQPLLV